MASRWMRGAVPRTRRGLGSMEALRLRLAAGPTGAFGLAGSRGVAEIARVRWRQEDSAPGRSDSSNDPSHEILSANQREHNSDRDASSPFCLDQKGLGPLGGRTQATAGRGRDPSTIDSLAVPARDGADPDERAHPASTTPDPGAKIFRVSTCSGYAQGILCAIPRQPLRRARTRTDSALLINKIASIIASGSTFHQNKQPLRRARTDSGSATTIRRVFC